MKHFMVICRKASDYLLTGYKAGYVCDVCGKQLQASPVGQQQIASGARPLCNTCGAGLIEMLQKDGTAHEVVTNPAAREQFDRIIAKLKQEHAKS